MRSDVQRAVAARNAAFSRVRLATGITVGVGAALTAAFSALAAGSTHLKKTVATKATTTTTTAATKPKAAPPVTAPAPPLVSVQSDNPSPTAPPAQAPASPTPAAPASPPVVVSGGS